jgi:hypothetical protein
MLNTWHWFPSTQFVMGTCFYTYMSSSGFSFCSQLRGSICYICSCALRLSLIFTIHWWLCVAIKRQKLLLKLKNG